MLRRWISGAIGGISTANGLVMLLVGKTWFETTPGVAATGPFNPHFVADVGAAYAVAGAALISRAVQPHLWPAAVAGAGFFAAHALIHVAGHLGGRAAHAGFEWAAVILPAALGLWAAFPARGEVHA